MKLVKAEDVKELLLGLDSLPWEEQVDEIVDAIPTAYDVEAVVRELEEKIEHHWEQANYCYDNELYIANSEHLGKCEAFRDAIEIVKRGGRNEL